MCIAYMLLVSTCMYVAIYWYCCTQNTRHDFYRLGANQSVAPPFCHNYYPFMHGHIQCASIHPPLPHLSFLPSPFYFLSSSFVVFSSISSLSLSSLSLSPLSLLLFLGTDSWGWHGDGITWCAPSADGLAHSWSLCSLCYPYILILEPQGKGCYYRYQCMFFNYCVEIRYLAKPKIF